MTPPPVIDAAEMSRISAGTVAHYRRVADAYRDATWSHDVGQNIQALLDAIHGEAPLSILDLGCGPGRDLIALRDLGHAPIGLDACPEFVDMARAASGCEVWCQDMLAMDLPLGHFDGVFANAVLFHVPSAAMPRVLRGLYGALRPGGVMVSSNPRGQNEEGFADARYTCFYDLPTWRRLGEGAGLELLHHYFRPPGRPRREQPWLATVWRRPAR